MAMTTQAMTWHSRTYRTEWDLRRFLSTLTADQLAEAQVIEDDGTFVVFYLDTVATNLGADALFGLFGDDFEQSRDEDEEVALMLD